MLLSAKKFVLLLAILAIAGRSTGSGQGPDVKSVPASPRLGDRFTNSVGVTLTYIPPGEFIMGSAKDERGRNADESPQHKVMITQGFFMSTTEITQAQYRAIMGQCRSHFIGDRLPAEGVSQDEGVEYCDKLSVKESRTYRLPTEAEWEYACRAGKTTRYACGDDERQLAKYANFAHDKTTPVGSFEPNAFGLYDMHGNLWEWCADWYGPYLKGTL